MGLLSWWLWLLLALQLVPERVGLDFAPVLAVVLGWVLAVGLGCVLAVAAVFPLLVSAREPVLGQTFLVSRDSQSLLDLGSASTPSRHSLALLRVPNPLASCHYHLLLAVAVGVSQQALLYWDLLQEHLPLSRRLSS